MISTNMQKFNPEYVFKYLKIWSSNDEFLLSSV